MPTGFALALAVIALLIVVLAYAVLARPSWAQRWDAAVKGARARVRSGSRQADHA